MEALVSSSRFMGEKYVKENVGRYLSNETVKLPTKIPLNFFSEEGK